MLPYLEPAIATLSHAADCTLGSLAALMTRDLVGRTKTALLVEKVFRPVVALVDIATAISHVLGRFKQADYAQRDLTTVPALRSGLLANAVGSRCHAGDQGFGCLPSEAWQRPAISARISLTNYELSNCVIAAADARFNAMQWYCWARTDGDPCSRRVR